ncbi:haloacid dehalogenase type II [Gemmobacter lutimaris]|uniref:(S)-2-haloacid dehalogenase n=1 Tax=Gemmobacter lutimaris TaxID=2306023 RepID=A0A398BMV5_9RHOB|nr:haloacid dehalogenase type II [Gemmobacter lutimaris]RID91825.1 haloacid dehalogenase type II [Gemmobacter lutimaris]
MQVSVVVFDAYGTLFDVAGAARVAAASDSRLAGLWPRLADDWRRKQLEYTWLRSLMRDHADFATVTAEALDWAMEAAGLEDVALRTRLLALYDELPAYPEVPAMLAAVQARGLPRAILSNGTPAMLASATRAAGVASMLDAVLSVEDLGIYKPDPAVYALVTARFDVAPADVLFVSSNGWDVAGASAFGFRTLWVNRMGAPVDRLPGRPDHIARDLSSLTDLLP